MKKLLGLVKVRKEKTMKGIPGIRMKLLFSGSILALSLSVSISQASKSFYDRSKSDFTFTLLGRKIFESKTVLVNQPAVPKAEDTLPSTGRRKAEFIPR